MYRYTFKEIELQIICRNAYFELKYKRFSKHFIGCSPSIRF